MGEAMAAATGAVLPRDRAVGGALGGVGADAVEHCAFANANQLLAAE